ncbi:tetratricopeptide repeat protein [Alloprevotella rava]|uniref:Tetratricopeptide (TPR) repeat protein n=1 Tax=Alloprevotella rava TaxID=671218 RepID=A0A7W5UKP3_9BACT|nr:tetratricopeptide repeat protein [Alloprevotella rava]MBB3703267.1 tetratricopeptide (TPR) repeat protein [Alloprevotella rava]
MAHQSKKQYNTKSPSIAEGLLHLLTFLLIFVPSILYAQINITNVLLMGRNALSVDDNLSAIRYFNQVIEARSSNAEAWYLRGFAKFSLEDFHGADTDCSQSILLNPYKVEVYQLRGLCRINLKDYQGAINDYARTLAEMPDNEDARFNRAYCFMQIKEMDSAKVEINKILRRSPKFYRAYMAQAQIHLEENDTLKAVIWMDSLLTFRPNESQVWQFKGQYALSKDLFSAADSFLTQAIKYAPNDNQSYLLRAMVRNSLNRFDAAIMDYDKVISLIPQHFVAHYNRALLRALVGDDNRAIQDFSFILKVEPQNTLARYNRALLCEKTGDYRGAIRDYTVLIKAYPRFMYGYIARAKCRRKIGDTKGALNDETIIARAELDVSFARPRRSIRTKVRMRSDHALEHYDRMIAEEPDTAKIFGDGIFGKVQNSKVEARLMPNFQLALLSVTARGYRSIGYQSETEELSKRFAPLEFQAEQQAGRSHYQRNVKYRLFFTAEKEAESIVHSENYKTCIDTLLNILTDTDAYLLRSMLAYTTYDYNSAWEYAKKAVSLNPKSVIALQNRANILGMLYLNANKEQKLQYAHQAIADMEEAIKLKPNNAYSYYNRGCLLASFGKVKEADTDFTTAITLDNHFAEAYYNRAVLRLQDKRKQEAIPDLSRAGELGLYQAYSLLKEARN